MVLARQAFDARCKGRDLAQFLVAPVQRVPRYRLLLEALVLRTNEDHADRNDLDEALTLEDAGIFGVVGGALSLVVRTELAETQTNKAPPEPEVPSQD